MNKTKFLSNESVVSIVYRSAKANYYQSPNVFKNALGMSMNMLNANNFTIENCREFALLIGSNECELYFRSTHFYSSIDILQLLRTRIKYCPYCIREILHHQWQWSFTPITICLTHKKSLIDKCHCCSSYISINSLFKGNCPKCGSQFEDAKSNDINTNSYQYKSQRDLFKRLKGQEVSLLQDFSMDEYIKLAKKVLFLFEDQNSFIAPHCEIIHSFTRKGKENYYSNDNLQLALANVYWMFSNFPNNFYKVLDGFEQIHYSIRKRRMSQFKQGIKGEKMLFIKEALEHYFNLQIESGNTSKNISVYNQGAAMRKSERFLTKKEVRKEYGVGIKQLERMVDDTLITPKIIKRGKAVQYLFNKNDLLLMKEMISQEKSKLINIQQASSRLGISVKSIHTLINEGLLMVTTVPWAKGGFVSKKDVVQLLVGNNVIYGSEISNELINYSRLLDKFATSGVSVTKIFVYIKEGKLRPRTNTQNPKLPDYYFHIKEIQQLLTDLKTQNQKHFGYNFNDVQEILKIGSKTLHKLIDLQLLIPSKKIITGNGRKFYWFPKETIDNFQEQFLTPVQAEHELRIPQNRVRRWVQQGKVNNLLDGISRKMWINRNELVMFHLKENN
ncbi:TniQ family protein [Lysinibacillus xylanilyticus]|uniref:TniQ family protein n=1 Tax=Lysinibacillus xylanilyticus TaxID=582475 RepID=UPI0037FABE42